MSFYIHIEDGKQTYPLTLTDLRIMQPNVSFPMEISDEDAATFGFYPVEDTPEPVAPTGKRVVRGEPVQKNGKWAATWVLVDITPEETEAQWSAVRADRNARLSASDWTQLPDAPVDHAVWAEYRQALRDVTEQTDPFAIVWPQEP